MQRLVDSQADCQPPTAPQPAPTQRASDPPSTECVARPLSVSEYLEELWAVEARPSQLVRPDAEGDETARLQPEEDDEADGSAAAAVAAASGPGSLSALLHSLYQVPPAVQPAAASRGARHVHLLPRHPNLMPIEEWSAPAAAVSAAAAASSSPAQPRASSGAHQLRFASVPLSLHSLLRFYHRPGLLSSMSSSPSQLSASAVLSPAQTRFLVYQLLHALTWLHEECGVSHGDLTPANCRLTISNGKVWVVLGGMRFEMPEAASEMSLAQRQQRRPRRSSAAHRPRVERLLSPLLPPAESLCYRWWSGALSNMQYILALNALAGRTPFGAGSGAGNGGEAVGPCSGDVAFHPIVPWVVDFAATDAAVAAAKAAAASSSADGASSFSLAAVLPSLLVYRDLRKSKYRLKKGDEQLDFQFTASSSMPMPSSSPHSSSSKSAPPYHITECLSDITFYVYRARITPLSTLRRVVRANFVPEEYPNTMSRMEQWTPDEAIPELFGVHFNNEDTSATADWDSPMGSASASRGSAAAAAADFMKALPGHREKGMYDLAVPQWIVEIEEEKRRRNAAGGTGPAPAAVSPVASDLDPHALFLAWHASQLESEAVSMHLHHWIDLNFGYKLSGAAAVAAKNVPLLYEPHMQQPAEASAAAAGGRAGATNAANNQSGSGSASGSPLCVFDLPRRPSFMQLFDRPHPPRRALSSRKVAPAATASAGSHAGTTAAVETALTESSTMSLQPSSRQAPRSPGVVAAPSDASTALASIPGSLSTLHSFEYFHSFNSTLFEPVVEGGCYRCPPRGIMQWRRDRAREEERKRRRRRGDASSSDSSSDDGEDEDSSFPRPAASSPSSCHSLDADSEVASLSERAADDLFRFGLILFELYAQRPLFTEKSFHAYCACVDEAKALAVLMAPLPTEIAAATARCLALDWRARATAGELLRAPVHGGLGLFRVLVPHAPHALTLSPLTNLMLNPYAALWTFLRRFRTLLRRYAGGMEGLLGSHARVSTAAGASTAPGTDDATPAASVGSVDTSASAMLLTPFSVPSQRLYSAHSSRPATPTPQRSALSDSHQQQQTVHSTFSFSTSNPLHGSSQARSGETTDAASAQQQPMLDSSHCFWSCAAHGIAQALPPPSTDDEPTDVASILRWSLSALHDLHATLWHAAPSVFLLSLPHVLDLCLTPSFLHDPSQHDLLRLVIHSLARWVGPAHAAVHVAPFVAQLLFHSTALPFQLSFVWQMDTLRMVRDRFAYRDMQQPYMRALRNAMLSSVPALAERAHDLLLACVLQEMDLGSTAAAVPRSAALSVVAASPRPTDEELLVFELLRPMFQRLSASPASTYASPQPSSSSGLVSPPPSSSSVDKILHFLNTLLPELPTALLASFVLPNVLQLVSASGVHVLPSVGQIGGGGLSSGIGGAGGGRSAPSSSTADLDGKLASALDLLFVILPDLGIDTLHALLAEESLLRALFLSVSPAPPLVGGIAPRSISALCMRKVIQIMIYACCELSGDKADLPPAGASSRSGAQQLQLQSSRFSFFLPCVSDFLRGVIMRLDGPGALDPTLATHYTSGELQGFLHSVYVSLSSILGRPTMQQSIAQADKVENMVQEHAKQQYINEAQARTAAAATAAEHPTAAAAAALQSASSGMSELLRARQHALQAKNARLTWLRAQQSRALALQHSREQLQHERAELAFHAGISIAGDRLRRPRPDAAVVGTDAFGRPRGSFIDTSASASSGGGVDGVSVVVDLDAEGGGGDEDLSGDEADDFSPAVHATPQQPATKSQQQQQQQQQQPDGKGGKKNKLTGFFSTGIFAPRGSPNHSANPGGAGSQQLASSSSAADSSAQSLINALPPPNLSAASVSSSSAAASAGAPLSAVSPPLQSLPLSNARVALDFGDMILPPLAAFGGAGSAASTTPAINARFEPVMRCTFRAHVGAISSLDCHPASGLFISSSRNADAHSTVKLWSVSVSDASIRPLFDYSKKHHASASALPAPPRFPKSIVSHVALLVNPYEVLNAAFAYCDGAQLHVCDIETHKPVVFRHNSGHISSGGGSMAQPVQTVSAGAKGQPPARHLSSTSDPLQAASTPIALISPTSSSSSSAGVAHHFKADGSPLIGGISCFDYSPALHSLVLGTSSGSLRWLDLRSGAGFVSSAWHSNNSAPVAPALRCVLASESGSDGIGGSCAASSLVYTGLSNGEVVVFDARTGCALLQWRAHDAPILQMAATHNSEGMPVLVVSGADHTISVWLIAGGVAPILLQRFLNLEDNARGLIILRGAAGGATQLSCTIGSRMALVSLQTAELSPGSKRPSTVLPLAPVSGYKGKSLFSCQSHLPLYGLSLLGTEDGRIIGAK